jgi:hypothetical protein
MPMASDSDREQELKLLAETWKTTIQVQQHFNEIEMKIRAAYVTVALALFAAQGYLIDKQLQIVFWSIAVQLSVFLPLIGLVVTYMFYFVDRHWYHRLLMGAVKHGMKLEELYPNFPSLALTSAIGRESPVKPKSVFTKIAVRLFVTDHRDDGALHSDAKMELFYKPIMWIFFLIFLGAILSGGVSGVKISRL